MTPKLRLFYNKLSISSVLVSELLNCEKTAVEDLDDILECGDYKDEEALVFGPILKSEDLDVLSKYVKKITVFCQNEKEQELYNYDIVDSKNFLDKFNITNKSHIEILYRVFTAVDENYKSDNEQVTKETASYFLHGLMIHDDGIEKACYDLVNSASYAELLKSIYSLENSGKLWFKHIQLYTTKIVSEKIKKAKKLVLNHNGKSYNFVTLCVTDFHIETIMYLKNVLGVEMEDGSVYHGFLIYEKHQIVVEDELRDGFMFWGFKSASDSMSKNVRKYVKSLNIKVLVESLFKEHENMETQDDGVSFWTSNDETKKVIREYC